MARPIDFSKDRPTNGSKGPAKDKARFWNTRYKRFKKAGYSEKECIWAADQGLLLGTDQVKRMLLVRSFLVYKLFMRKFHMTEEVAIETAANDLRTKLDRLGYEEDELNLFLEESP